MFKIIWSWVCKLYKGIRERGFSLHKYAYAFHLAGSLVLMVILRLLNACTPLWAVVIVAAVGLFKEFVIDELIRKRPWDWKDLMMDGIGIGFGFLFTAGYYKLMGI